MSEKRHWYARWPGHRVAVTIETHGPFGSASSTTRVPRRIAKDLLAAMNGVVKPPKITSKWAPMRLMFVYLGSVFALFLVDITADWSNEWYKFGAYLVALTLSAIGFNYGSAALRRVIQLQRERDSVALRTASGSSPHSPIGAFARSLHLPPGALVGPGFFSGTPGAGPGVDEPLKETTADVPILAYKGARLSFEGDGKFALKSLNEGLEHEADAEAICTRWPTGKMEFFDEFGNATGKDPIEHGPVPRVDCTCGFYAVKDPTTLGPCDALLTVELSGKVIVFEPGYRAQYQRILSMAFKCRACARLAEQVFVDLGDHETLAVCSSHPIRSSGSWVSFELADVAPQLGIPLAVADEEHDD